MTIARTIRTAPALAAMLMLCGCNRPERSVEWRGDQLPAPCTRVADGQVRYATAAGFGLATPEWMLRLPSQETFTRDCRLTSLTLHFALADGALTPLPHPGVQHPAQPTLPDTPARLSLRLRFDEPRVDDSRADVSGCAVLPVTGPYDVVMCPDLDGSRNPQLPNLPYYPRFELSGANAPPASMTCRHEDLRDRTIANIADLAVPYTCRGYWQWRPGAHAMFDLGPGEALKTFSGAIASAQTTLDAWAAAD